MARADGLPNKQWVSVGGGSRYFRTTPPREGALRLEIQLLGDVWYAWCQGVPESIDVGRQDVNHPTAWHASKAAEAMAARTRGGVR